MRRKPAARCGIVIALLCGFCWAPAARGATAHVQYLSSSSVYLDAGRDAGLVEGTRVRVERDGQVVAELLVEFVAERSAACRIVSGTGTVRSGDTCVFEPAVPPASAAAPPVPPPGAAGGTGTAARGRTGNWPSASAVNGSISMYYRRSTESDGTFSNPALRADARWDGAERRQIAVRLRADRPAVSADPSLGVTPGAERLRIYEAQVRYRGAGEKLDVSAGRFIPPGMELVGYMDGGEVVYRPWQSFRMGVLGGRGSQLGSNGFTTGGYKVGGFFEAADAHKGAPSRWRALAGAALLQDPDVTRRQFMMLRSDQRFATGLRTYENVEVDVSPGWARALGDPTVDLTTLSLGTQISPHRAVDLTVGYDSRRDLRAPETRLVNTPPLPLESTQGGFGAVHLRFARWAALRLGGDFRRRSDGTRITRSWDATAYGSHPSLRQLSATLHANFYDASPGRGEQYDLFLSWLAHARLRFDTSAGSQITHDVTDPSGAIADLRTRWLRLGADLQLGHGLWLDGTGEWRSASGSRDFYVEVGQRF